MTAVFPVRSNKSMMSGFSLFNAFEDVRYPLGHRDMSMRPIACPTYFRTSGSNAPEVNRSGPEDDIT